MPHRYNGRDENNIPNTDNEETMLISGVPEEQQEYRRELPPLKRVNRRAPQQGQQREYTENQEEKPKKNAIIGIFIFANLKHLLIY